MTPKQSCDLDALFENRPGSIRNSMFIYSIRILAWILAILSLSLGISFLVDGVRDWINSDFTIAGELFGRTPATRAKGFFLISLSACLFLIVFLCKIILRRNKFILDIFIWYENLRNEERREKLKTSAPDTKK